MKRLEKEVRVVTPEFKERRNGKYETIRTYAKMARGEMTRYILLNRLNRLVLVYANRFSTRTLFYS